ncbi:MAG: 3-oxoacyl-[acyl-carrier-protein] reductase [Firmicutes bacterium]|nr:3-oxoacyl-[acyl-carrier-protein] reductase [Bacillota bacterium]
MSTAIVTGGSRGIGKATALKLAEAGNDIVIVDVCPEDVSAAACAEIEAKGVKAKALALDVSNFDAVKDAMAEVAKEFGTIDIIVNCAGITRDGLMAMMKEDAFDAVINVNLKGTFNMIRHCTPYFMKQRSGCIINVASVAGIMGNAGQANYSASKAGVIGLTKTTAKELVSRGVRCNAVAPGFVATDMTQVFADNDEVMKQIPMKRMAQAEEVADLIAYLASDKATYITGEIIRIDGGVAI